MNVTNKVTPEKLDFYKKFVSKLGKKRIAKLKAFITVQTTEGKPDVSNENLYYAYKYSKLSEFDIEKAKQMIIEETAEDVEPDLTWRAVYHAHKCLQRRTFKVKREIVKRTKVCSYNLHCNYQTGYFTFNLNNVVNDLEELATERELKKYLYKISAPYSDMLETADRLGVNMISFVPGTYKDVKGIIPKGMTFEKFLERVYTFGLQETSTGDKYLPIGLSASKARSGGIIWMANLSDWNAVERFRAEVLHLSFEEYQKTLKDKVVIAKYETGTIGMRTSAVINVSKAGVDLRGNNDVLKNIRYKVVPDIRKDIEVDILESTDAPEGKPEMKPFSFKKVRKAMEIIPSDGSSIIKLQKYVDILHQLGKITDKQYEMFSFKWKFYNYDPKMLWEDKDLRRFIKSKEFTAVLQVRFFGGVKGTVIPVAEMDGDPRLADTDMLIFKKSAKYISDEAPFEVINWAKRKSEAQLNYQFVQSTVTDPNVLIKGADRAFETLDDVLTDPAKALKFIGGIRHLDDDAEMALMTKLANDLEAEPKLLHEHYHFNKLCGLVEKRVKETGFGKIPVKGAFQYIISDPVWLYHMAMGDTFESELKAGEVFYQGINGYTAGLWRSPMIHFSEPQKAMCKYVDYLWMYKDIVVLNPYDAIAPSLGGADYDGDKVLIIIDENDESFESLFVQQIQSPGYIICDDGGTAKPVANTISNRIKYFIALSVPNKTGQITNWATSANDLMINGKSLGDKALEKWNGLVLIRDRLAQEWEIGKPKSGIGAEGPDGDMLPVKGSYSCKPSTNPQWFVDKCKYEKRPVKVVDKEGKSLVHKSIAPMAKLHEHAEKYWDKIQDTVKKLDAITIDGVMKLSLTEEDMEAFESIKLQVMEYERLYRNQIKTLMNLNSEGLIDDFNLELEELIGNHYRCLNSLIGGKVNSDVVAYACYYAANNRFTEDGKIARVDGSRSYPWTCYYAETLSLLYRNNNSKSLVALPNREMETVEILGGELYIDGKFVKEISYPDGSYEIKEIDSKPYIMVDREVNPEPPTTVVYGNRQYQFECSRFTMYNQKVNSEEFMNIINKNDKKFDIKLLDDGTTGICIDGKLYAIIQVCPQALLNKKVALAKNMENTDLCYVPKRKTKTTVMKNSKLAYKQMLEFTVIIVGEADEQEIEIINENKIVREDYDYGDYNDYSLNNYEPIYDDSTYVDYDPFN